MADLLPLGATLEHLLSSLAFAAVVVDRRGRIVRWNDAATALLGFTEQEALGRPAVDLLPPQDRSIGKKVIAEAFAGTPWSDEVPLLAVHGQIRAKVSASPVRDAGEVASVLLTAEDVTARHDLAREAARLADHLRLALEAGRLGTWRWDMAAGTVVWDATLETLFGLAPGTFDGSFDTYVGLLHPDDREAVLAIVADAVERGISYQLDHRVVWPDGSVHWLQGRGTVTVDEDGSVTGTIGCTADITDRKLAELETERRAAAAAEAAAAERLANQRLAFLVRLSDAALTAHGHRDYMEAVTTAAVPQLGDWCSLHFLPYEAMDPEIAVAHVDPAKVAWAEELTRRYPFDRDAPAGWPP